MVGQSVSAALIGVLPTHENDWARPPSTYDIFQHNHIFILFQASLTNRSTRDPCAETQQPGVRDIVCGLTDAVWSRVQSEAFAVNPAQAPFLPWRHCGRHSGVTSHGFVLMD